MCPSLEISLLAASLDRSIELPEEGLAFGRWLVFDDSSYQDTLREHERSHHPVGGAIFLVLIVAIAVGLCLLLI
jgi:hypothetical protein